VSLNTILMNDFKTEPLALKRAMHDAVARVLDSGWFVLGAEGQAFETAWAQTCGVPYAMGVGNGMDAIEIALRACGVGAGDEVITTSMTAFATVLAIVRAGATPVLADIDSQTGLLSLDSVQRCLSARTRAVVPVHLYGQVRDMSLWQQWCQSHGLHLIEDCAQAHLAAWNGQVAGSFGVAGAYSFYPTKNLGALGDGGMVVTSDPELAACATRLRNYGQSVRYHHPELGMNSRLDEVQAAILIERLKYLSEFTQRRRQIAQAYRSRISTECVTLLAPPAQEQAHVYHLFVVTCGQRDALQQHLLGRHIQSLIHYPVPVHHQAPCRQFRTDPAGMAHTERHAQQCLSLPCHPQMSDDDVDRVIDAVNAFQGV
jgi:dTDP-4-amino-4,6-dideoxygalactose transaminase